MVPEDFYDILPLLVSADGVYRELFQESEALEPECSIILSNLTQEERELIVRYISLREQLEYRATRLAASHYAVNGATAFVK